VVTETYRQVVLLGEVDEVLGKAGEETSAEGHVIEVSTEVERHRVHNNKTNLRVFLQERREGSDTTQLLNIVIHTKAKDVGKEAVSGWQGVRRICCLHWLRPAVPFQVLGEATGNLSTSLGHETSLCVDIYRLTFVTGKVSGNLYVASQLHTHLRFPRSWNST